MRAKTFFTPASTLILTLILTLLPSAVALGSQAPFQDGLTITTTADGAWAVYAADLDDDGDLDVLSAANDDNQVAWYENDGGLPPTFTTHVITTDANGVRSVYAADVNGDGDLDVLSASFNDDKIAWYENDGGPLPAFTAHTITTSADGARSVYAADVDNDGDLDILLPQPMTTRLSGTRTTVAHPRLLRLAPSPTPPMALTRSIQPI